MTLSRMTFVAPVAAGEVLRRVVDDVFGAQGADQLEVPCAGDAGDLRPERCGDLDGKRPDAAGCAVDKDAGSRSDLADVADGEQGGEPANLRHHDSVIGCLRAAGFSIKQAIHVFSLLDSYVSGFALQELTLPFDTSDELAEAAESILAQFPAAEYPHLAETITEHVTKSGYNYADEFEVGLDLILEGIERLRDTA